MKQSRFEQLGIIMGGFFRYRWAASILMIILLDISTYMAFKESGGAQTFAHQDKILHALGFFVLFIVGHISLNFDFFPRIGKFSPGLFLINWLIWIGYGLFIELVQKFLSYRSSSLGDLVADLFGMLLGTWAVLAVKLYPGRTKPS